MAKTASATSGSAPIPRPGIMEIAAYVGGESKLAGVGKVMKLASNESATRCAST